MEEKKAKEDQGARGTGQVDRVCVGPLFLFLVFGDQQQLVALVKPEGTVGDEELVVALDEHD